MRLLKLDEDGALTFAEFFDKKIPPYAILSHTWEDEEVIFKDLLEGTAQNKAGYKKILFCGKQAAQDKLEYFWLDTCCINKSDSSELAEALNSMFRWYHNAAKCYVYMSDVSRPSSDANYEANQLSWASDFSRSRWFTRGWTLQELIAPTSVEFFSKEGEPLGNKQSLEMPIHERTQIPLQALQGCPLSDFSVEERFSWAENRDTTRQEDKVYSLLGIFEIFMSPIYGEGEDHARGRLREAIDKPNQCLRDLRPSDPEDDMIRIINSKGGLLEDSYRWIIDNPEFQEWRDLDHRRLLWVKGDPGKGKTMLLCGIIKELKSATQQASTLKAFFFFQAADSRINSATSLLRGLIYQLVMQQPSLISHVQKKYGPAGRQLFEDANAWTALTDIFTNILQHRGLKTTYLIIDALDECIADRQQLLDFIADKSASAHVKWIVSSRNWTEIEERLRIATEKVMLSLELNETSISAAVGRYIEHKVNQLTWLKNYDRKLRNAVQHHLSSNANGTFLWVALVCQHLDKVDRINTLAKLNTFPPGLNPLYKRMMDQICGSDNADLCKQILAVVSTVYRPITFKELTTFVEMPEVDCDDCESQSGIISICGSFLTLREGTIYFVHQSAKDFLIKADQIFPSGMGRVHYSIFSLSLDTMSKTLQRNLYSLNSPGFPIDQVKNPQPDPLAAVRYSCVYWVSHLYDFHRIAKQENNFLDGSIVDKFLREKYLYWLEALSLLRSISEGIVAIEKLRELLQTIIKQVRLTELVEDAYRFVRHHKLVIENHPLQVYVSALMFSPARCLTRKLFKQEEPKWLFIKPEMEDSWSNCLQTLEGHSGLVNSAAFSHDSKQVVSASDDKTVKIWDTQTGKCLQTLKGHSGSVNSAAFSHDSKQVVSASDDKTVKIWDTQTGKCLQTLKGHSGSVRSAAFSHDSKQVVSASYDETVKIWDTQTGKCLQTLKGHSHCVRSAAFSHDSKQVVSASDDKTVKIWDTQTGKCLQTLKGHSGSVRSAAFSHDSKQVVSASYDETVKIWDTQTGKCLQTLKGHSHCVRSAAFSHDSKQVVSASDDKTVKIWDTQTGKCLETLNIGSSLSERSFDLDTKVGTIVLDKSLALNIVQNKTDHLKSSGQGYGLSFDGRWITQRSSNLLSLPLEYQASCSAVAASSIAIGCYTGRVLIFNFH